MHSLHCCLLCITFYTISLCSTADCDTVHSSEGSIVHSINLRGGESKMQPNTRQQEADAAQQRQRVADAFR